MDARGTGYRGAGIGCALLVAVCARGVPGAARRQAFDQAIALTQRYASLAVTTLARVMADAAAPHTAKVSAASAMLRFGRESIELDDLSARIEALEEQRTEDEE